MRETRSGFVVPQAGEAAIRDVYRAMHDYLGHEDHDAPMPATGWAIVVRTCRDAPVLLVEVEVPTSVSPGGPERWFEKAYLCGSSIAGRLDCEVFAFVRDGRTGYEFVEVFDEGGSVDLWARDDEDDGPTPTERLADALELRHAFLFDGLLEVAPIRLPLDEKLDAKALKTAFAALRKMPSSAADPSTVVTELSLPTSMLETAGAAGASVTEVMLERVARGLPALREALEGGSDAVGALVAPASSDPRQKHELPLSRALMEDVRDLVELSDRPSSWLVAAAFKLGA